MLAPYKYLCGFYLRVDMKHGMTGTRIYKIWCKIKERCYNPNNRSYKNYGSRGITVCDEWRDDFQAFYDWAMSNGYADELTIDRISVNGNYEPSNCRWATNKEQCNNKRNNHILTYNEKSQTVAQWANELKTNDSTICERIRRGVMSDMEILSKPIMHPHHITLNGETKTLNQWSKQTGISYSTLHKRIFTLHWNIEKALTT